MPQPYRETAAPLREAARGLFDRAYKIEQEIWEMERAAELGIAPLDKEKRNRLQQAANAVRAKGEVLEEASVICLEIGTAAETAGGIL